MSDSVRLVVNASLCDGHGICVLRCPELITLDQWGFAAVDSRTVTDTRVVRRARRAVAACPRRALTLDVVQPAAPTSAGPHLVALPGPANDETQQKNKTSCNNKELATVHNRNHEAG